MSPTATTALDDVANQPATNNNNVHGLNLRSKQPGDPFAGKQHAKPGNLAEFGGNNQRFGGKVGDGRTSEVKKGAAKVGLNLNLNLN